jgi:hypothetical protein
VYNPDTDMLFPARAIPNLKDLRGEEWADLVERVMNSEEDSIHHMGFTLMMIKLGGCTSCHADSFRAMRGCTQCSQQTIGRFKGTDEELEQRFTKARSEMEAYLEKRRRAKSRREA